jgi:hypothetical protein
MKLLLKSKILDISFKDCIMTESELTTNAFMARKETKIMKDLTETILFGDLPSKRETQKALGAATETVLNSLTDITCNTEIVTEDFVKQAIHRSRSLLKQEKSEADMNKEILSPKQMQSVLQDIREQKISAKARNLRNLNLTNGEWKNLMHMAGSGDTMDMKNVLLVWNTIRKTTWEIKINAKDPKGTHDTCDYVEHINNVKKVCSNYINPGEQKCSVHRTMQRLCSNTEQHLSLFPVMFSGFVMYIKPDYDNKFIGRFPKTFQISRKLLTKEFKDARGN